MDKPIRVEDIPTPPTPNPPSTKVSSKVGKTSKGIENAKKRLRAFSIQKKTTVPAVPATPAKPVTAGSNTVVIGKLSSVKLTPKPTLENDEQKKPQKPPKPGTSKKCFQETYSDLQKKTLAEIEDMKRKMELVDLGIPLGLICPAPDSDKAMPTKAMPPIKTFLEPAKVDELIREAKKARAEGRAFKFDYNKLLPDYDNPFQRKKEDQIQDKEKNTDKTEPQKTDKDRHKDKKHDRHDSRRYSGHRRDKDRSRSRDDKNKDKVDKVYKAKVTDVEKEADVNLSDYLVCDSWSLDNDDKNSSSPHIIEEKKLGEAQKPTKTTVDTRKENKKDDRGKIKDLKTKSNETSEKKTNPSFIEYSRLEKLRPVNDSFEFEIDPNEETLDIINKDSKIKKSTKAHGDKIRTYDCDLNSARESSFEDMNDESFLESVINEIKQEDLSDVSQDKALVEYDDSPKDDEFSMKESQGSVTPELNDSVRSQSSHNRDFSGYRSTESGYRSTESGYKSNETGFKSTGSECRSLASSLSSDSYQTIEKEMETYDCDMSKSTVESLELWSFVLKICQPLLFRHDKNKCYKETHSFPKLWYAENPKLCNCVKDRAVVYDELEIFKPDIVDRLYGQYQYSEETSNTIQPSERTWHPHMNTFLSDMVQLSSEWEMEDSQIEIEENELKRNTLTPQQSEALTLDMEYQRFMDAVWPEISESKKETSRSTTPVQESRKKKIVDVDKNIEESKKSKKVKSSSEGWSQESDMQDEGEKSVKKPKVEKEKKILKRRRSTSTLSTASDDEVEAKRKKKSDKRANKKLKSKSLKASRNEKRKLKKLKEKERKKKKHIKAEKNTDNTDDAEESKKKERRKLKRKKQMKLKRKILKKKAKKTSSSSDDSDSSTESSSESESEVERKSKKAKKKNLEARKKRKEKRRKHRKSTDSNQDLFDVNILNNIKTERLTDDEKSQKKLTDQDFSPRRQQKKRQEIINVKELQDDFVGNNIHVKQEKEDLHEHNVENKFLNNETSGVVVHNDKPNEAAKNEKTAAIVNSEKTIEKTENNKTSVTGSVHVEITAEEKDVTIEPLIEELNENFDLESNVMKTEVDTEVDTGVDTEVVCRDAEKNIEVMKEDIQKQDNINAENKTHQTNFKEPQSTTASNFKNITEESNLSQCSSQESIISVKDMPIYEKDDSHLRPSSQNSNYSFNDVISASQSGIYHKEKESSVVCDDKFIELYEPQNYEMYEQMAMAYQNDVANQQVYPVPPVMAPLGEHRIETVVGSRNRGEIKCDWRPGDTPTSLHPQRPSRWGLKPGEVNIVLTGGNTEHFPISTAAEPVYRIESIANRNDTGTGYDEAYMDMYGASDRLQYGDCFATDNEPAEFNLDSSAFSLNAVNLSNTLDNDTLQTDSPKSQRNSEAVKNTKRDDVIDAPKHSKTLNSPTMLSKIENHYVRSDKFSVDKSKKEDSNRASLEARIDAALKHTVLGEVAKEPECSDVENDLPEKGILITTLDSNRVSKRVSFADGYKPGQDSDVEEPPVKKKKKKKKVRRVGCAWPCPATHPDHVPLWDALPPPPPPPGSPPPPRAPRGPPAHLLRRAPPPSVLPMPPHALMQKFDPNSPIPNMMPPEPPPGLIGFP